MLFLSCLGRHFCLWCLMTLDQLKLSPASRGPVTLRTTPGIWQDNLKFESAGGNIKKAKLFNNAIRKPFFRNIPLSQVSTYVILYTCYTILTIKCALYRKINTNKPYIYLQVCPPGLHITLGIFYRLFVLLEEVAHELDLRCAVQHGQAGSTYEKANYYPS